jgi:hypothetical protein
MPEETAATLREGWLHTSDIARISKRFVALSSIHQLQVASLSGLSRLAYEATQDGP